MAIEVGNIVEGKVTGITNFGAFVQLENGVTGLVHISEVADAYVKDIKEFLQENQQVKCKVINIANGKIGLSIKQLNSEGTREARARKGSSRPPRSFEDKLARFMKDSDERLATLRRSQDSKRGGRGSRREF